MSTKDYSVFYAQIRRFLKKWPSSQYVIVQANKVLTKGVYGLYPILLIRTGLTRNWLLLMAQLFCSGFGFLFVSWLRKFINQSRPYEAWSIEPLIAKDTVGQSFPSRHVFSASVIGTVALANQPILGGLILLVAAVLAVLRVLGGVHYPKDVAVGFVLGILLGLPVFFW